MADIDCTFYPPGSKAPEMTKVVDCGFDPVKAAQAQAQDLAEKASEKVATPAKAKK